ncbi:MAG: DUF4192 domain-containing protein, partial [Mycobacteriaceae bacterium]
GATTGQWLPHRLLVRALRTGLEEVGTELMGAHHVGRVEPGATWSSYADSRGGVLPDPRCSPVAAAHVVAGRVLRASRAELVDTLAPEPNPGVTAALVAAQHTRERVSDHELLRGVLTVVSRVSPGEPLGLAATEVAALGVALRRLDVRDACFGLAGTARAHEAEALWTALTRALPPRSVARLRRCSPTAPMREVRARWRASRWRWRWGRTRSTAWPGCCPQVCRLGWNPLPSSSWCAPPITWRTGWGWRCQRWWTREC